MQDGVRQSEPAALPAIAGRGNSVTAARLFATNDIAKDIPQKVHEMLEAIVELINNLDAELMSGRQGQTSHD
jgi:hypothetical protein